MIRSACKAGLRIRRTRAARPIGRRGVASILAMMFMVMFSSLAIAMAVASQGNLRTAHTHLHVVRAMGAADTGMAIAQKRLADAVSRFVIERGVVNGDMGWRLWQGTNGSGDGAVQILAPRDGRPDVGQTRGLADALVNAHLSDLNAVEASGFPFQADQFTPAGDLDAAEYKTSAWVRTCLIGIDEDASEQGARPAAYQITYAPLANGTDVRIIVTGFSSIGVSGSSFGYGGSGEETPTRPVSRTIQQDFRVVKRPAHAMLSPSRIMIGKNVSINGDLGARYTDVAQNNGHPMVIRSDYLGLNATLDTKLTQFFAALEAADVDGDNRLRVGHGVEGASIPDNGQDFNGDGQPDNAFADATGDGFVDEFDLFINQYDANGDHRLTLSTALTTGTPAQGQAAEFTADDDLAILLDGAQPDRNRNNISGFNDTNRNGRWDSGEAIIDVDPRTGALRDRVLGWRDGYIDRRDQYAKVRGKLVFRTQEEPWTDEQGFYGQYLRGPIVPGPGQSPVEFGAGDDELPEISAATFTDSQTPLQAAADGQPFDQQVATQLGISTGQLATYTEANTNDSAPRFWRADLDDAYVYTRTGRHLYEKMPFNSPAFSDWYYRARYENMTFRNVQIPMGNNGLFVNCTFIGVTFVRSYSDNAHVNWSLYGKMAWNAAEGRPTLVFQDLDQSDFLPNMSGNRSPTPANADDFPLPPVINGVTMEGAARNTKLYSNNVRFHNCLIVGSLVADTPQAYTHIRNKLQFTGSTRFSQQNPDDPESPSANPDPEDVEEIAKSSLMAPNYSVDIGQVNSPTDTYQGTGAPPSQNVDLKGTIIAGVLDARGNTKIDGALLLTFAPVAGEGPLQYNGEAVGNPASFNATLGYFGPEDGDGESLDPETLPIVGGQRIAGWDTDGDGLSDVNADQPQPAGSTPVPFYGYGRVEVIWNPNLPMPDGVMLPISAVPLTLTYREGRQ